MVYTSIMALSFDILMVVPQVVMKRVDIHLVGKSS